MNWGADGSDSYAVHMILMAGDGSPYHSRILWFRGHGGAGLQGGEWGWNPGNESCESYPSTSFTALNPPDPVVDVFCSGHAGLGDGRIVLPGGTQPLTGSYGENASRLFTPGGGSAPGSWSDPGNLAERRWYPTATTLPDGRVLSLGGSKYPQHNIHGGRINGGTPSAPTGDLVLRFDPFVGGGWDAAVEPLADPISGQRPVARESHTAIAMPAGPRGQVWFGGRRADGVVLNDLWRLDRLDGQNVTAADYSYRWNRISPAAPLGILPTARAEHTAVWDSKYNQMLVFGGCDAAGNPVGDEVWRLWYTGASPTYYQWEQVIITGGTPPAVRFGHTAIFDRYTLTGGGDVSRMIVFGGVTAAGAAPADAKVYELRFSSASQASWTEMTETILPNVTRAPSARKGHTLGVGTAERTRTSGHVGHTAYLYGGELASGEHSDSLWTMWLLKDGTYAWEPRPITGGSLPGRRARHSLLADPGQGGGNGPRLFVFGGDEAGVLTDRFVYVIDPYAYSGQPDPAWQQWDDGLVATTRHTAVLDRNFTSYVHARVAEVYDPAVGALGQWSSLTNSTLLQPTYPVVFTIPGGPAGGARVVTASAWDRVARYLDIPAPGGTSSPWAALTGGDVGFSPQSGVLYRPNRIMVTGGRAANGAVTGQTKTRDLTNLAYPWVTSAEMTPRFDFNLVLLPDGKALAVGGTGTAGSNQYPVFRPQLWDPDGNGGLGTWTPASGADALAATTLLRGYHSSALLLPDARVVVSSGENTEPWQGFNHEKYKTDIYCPPYLFNTDGSPAMRPTIQWTPRRVSFGQTFIVGVNGTATVGSMCLIRPAAVTHGFDQNQRFIPLAFAPTAAGLTNPSYYKVSVPSDSAVVPPGEYMLFVLNPAGTPSVASWVRIGRTNGSTSQPTTVTDLHRQCSNGTSVTLLWSPPGSDVGDPVPAPAHRYDIRYRLDTMDSWQEFQGGTVVTNPPTPGDPTASSEDNVTITGLTQGQTYWFRLAAKNYASNEGEWSALSNQVSFLVHDEECGGSGGGGGGGYEEGTGIRSGPQGYSASSWRPGLGTPDSSFIENTLLPNAAINVARRDLLRLPFGPRWTADGARVRLSRAGTRATHFSSVRLLAVEHVAGEGAFVRGTELISGVTHDPMRVTHADGRDLTDMFLAGGAFEGRDGDTLYVDFGADGRGAFALTTSRAQLVRAPDRTGIDLASRDAAGWTDVGHHDVRERASDEVFNAPELRRVRLAFRGIHRLEALARLMPGGTLGVTAYEPIGAAHSRFGEVTASFAEGEGEALSPGDQLLVDFAASPPAEGEAREWYLEVTGTHFEVAGGVQGAKLTGNADPASPAAFALSAAGPNPFAGRTNIAFDVAHRSHVSLEVFDVLGRRIATLARGEYEAGRYSLAWDGRTAAGVPARPGVYLCRMRAGAFSARRTLVLRP